MGGAEPRCEDARAPACTRGARARPRAFILVVLAVWARWRGVEILIPTSWVRKTSFKFHKVHDRFVDFELCFRKLRVNFSCGYVGGRGCAGGWGTRGGRARPPSGR